MQLLFYIYEIKKSGIDARGILLFPEERKREEVVLDEASQKELDSVIKDIFKIVNLEKPPIPEKCKYCRNCAYSELCWRRGGKRMKKSAFIFSDGELKRKDSTVLFESEDSKNYLPIEDISDIYIFGEVTVTKKFLELATQKEILLHFYNYNEYYVGTYYPREHYNSGFMILKQAEHYLDEEKRMAIAKKFIHGSVKKHACGFKILQ